MATRDSMPMVSVRPGYITFFSEALQTRSSSKYSKPPPPLPEFNQPAGLISDKAQTHLCQKVDWMVYLALPKKIYPDRPHCKLKFRLNMLTLSLSSPQMHDDNTIKRELLQPFLDTLRKTWKCTIYLWRAETQKNGNIHFHLITDVYIPWWKIRNRWNDIQNKLGYVDRWKHKAKIKIPNSTDVHSIRHVKKLGAYLAKYCAKNPKGAMYTALQVKNGKLSPCYNPAQCIKVYPAAAGMYRAVQGKLWGLSYTLSKVRSMVCCTHDIADNSLQKLWALYQDKKKVYDNHTCLYVPVATWAKKVKGDLYEFFRLYLQEYRDLQPIPI